MLRAMQSAPVSPHPILPRYYRDAAGKRAFLTEIFDDTAGEYDAVENVLALGSGPWYRRRALKAAGLTDGMRVLDVAMGTGLVAREAAKLVGANGSILGVDPSAGMLKQALAKFPPPRSVSTEGAANTSPRATVSAVLAIGDALPIRDNAFDFLSMGYALRHLRDVRVTFGEFHRVLKPGGKVCILEISRPAGPIGRAVLAGYFRAVLPILAAVAGTTSKTRDLWKYYWETIDACLPPEGVMSTLHEVGFENVTRNVQLGIFSAYVGTKSAC